MSKSTFAGRELLQRALGGTRLAIRALYSIFAKAASRAEGLSTVFGPSWKTASDEARYFARGFGIAQGLASPIGRHS
jgi:hypothetical protein